MYVVSIIYRYNIVYLQMYIKSKLLSMEDNFKKGKWAEALIEHIAADLRSSKGISIYETSKDSLLRQEVVKKIESAFGHQGAASSLVAYIDTYMSKYPLSAISLLDMLRSRLIIYYNIHHNERGISDK